jgi:hypothetical protein
MRFCVVSAALSILALALRTYVRYVVPLTLLSALVFAPLLWFILRLPVPGDAALAKKLYVVAWGVAASAWIAQYVLVGGVAPAARGLAMGKPLSQLRALRDGCAGLGRVLLPCLVAVAAIAVGGLALVVPGVVLVVLLALTGASEARGMPAPLLDSIAVARANLKTVVLVVVAIVVVDLALAGVAYLVLFEPLAKKPTPAQLEASRWVARSIAAGLVVISPLLASVLAAVRLRART